MLHNAYGATVILLLAGGVSLLVSAQDTCKGEALQCHKCSLINMASVAIRMAEKPYIHLDSRPARHACLIISSILSMVI